MEIPKEQALGLIEQRLGSGQAAQAANELPDQPDHEDHADLLGKLGVDPQELVGGQAGPNAGTA